MNNSGFKNSSNTWQETAARNKSYAKELPVSYEADTLAQATQNRSSFSKITSIPLAAKQPQKESNYQEQNIHDWLNSEGPIRHSLCDSSSIDLRQLQLDKSEYTEELDEKEEREYQELQERLLREERDQIDLLERQQKTKGFKQRYGEDIEKSGSEQTWRRQIEIDGDIEEQEDNKNLDFYEKNEQDKQQNNKYEEQLKKDTLNNKKQQQLQQSQSQYHFQQQKQQSQLSNQQQNIQENINRSELKNLNNNFHQNGNKNIKNNNNLPQFETFQGRKINGSRAELITSLQRKYIDGYEDVEVNAGMLSEQSQQSEDLQSQEETARRKIELQRVRNSSEMDERDTKRRNNNSLMNINHRSSSNNNNLGRSRIGTEVEILVSEKQLLQQQVLQLKQENEKLLKSLEQQKDELSRVKDVIRQQDTIISEYAEQSRQGSNQSSKGQHLHSLLEQIQEIDSHTEHIFSDRLQQEKLQKQEIIEKNMILTKNIADLEMNLNYCRDYIQAQEKSTIKNQQDIISQYDKIIQEKEDLLTEETKSHRSALEIINEEIKKLLFEKQQAELSHEEQFRKLENSYQKELDEVKKSRQMITSKSRSTNEEYERLFAEFSRTKEVLIECQRQAKSCEMRNIELTEELAKERVKREGFQMQCNDKEKVRFQMFNELEITKKQLDSMNKEREQLGNDYKQLLFSFEIEGKRLKELEDKQLVHESSDKHLLEDIVRLRMERDQLIVQVSDESRKHENSLIELRAQMEKDKIRALESMQKEYLSKQNEWEQKLQSSEITVQNIKIQLEKSEQRQQETEEEGLEFDQKQQLLSNELVQVKLEKDRLTVKNQQLESNLQRATLTVNQITSQLQQQDILIQKITLKDDKNTRKQQEILAQMTLNLEAATATEKQLLDENAKLKVKINKIETDNFLQLEDFKAQLESYYNNLLIKSSSESSYDAQKELFQLEVLTLKKRICDLESDLSLSSLENGRMARDIVSKNDEIDALFNRLKEHELRKSTQFYADPN